MNNHKENRQQKTRLLTKMRVARHRTTRRDLNRGIDEASIIEESTSSSNISHESSFISSVNKSHSSGADTTDNSSLNMEPGIISECDESIQENMIEVEEPWNWEDGPDDLDSVSDVSEMDSDANEEDEIEELRRWAVQGRIPHTQLDLLLGILRKRLIPELPKSSKTFLRTNSKYTIEKLNENCEFVYFGMRESLERIINPNVHKDAIISLIFNVDGVSLHRSTSKQFWPILVKVYNAEQTDLYRPFPVAIHFGTEKPASVEYFFEKFLVEINDLLQNGINIGNKSYQIQVKAFICDRPARAFVKCIKGHGGYFACERCCVRGKRVSNRTTYPITDCEPRTDETFRNQSNMDHHKGNSPLLQVLPSIDMIHCFPLDAMHLVYLGIMKKLLHFWLKGKTTARLSQSAKLQLTYLLIRLQGQIPDEFQRTTRTLAEVEKYKATEFQFILLYAGPVILKKILTKTMYKHFMLLHTACRILSSKELALSNYEHAKRFLTTFVSISQQIYGKECLVGNMHSLIHLADDVEQMACPLSDITAFAFESELGKIKKMLRNGNRPLAQVCRRLSEECTMERPAEKPPLTIERKNKPESTGKITIKRVNYKGATLTAASPNNSVLLMNGTILQITEMYIPQNSTNSEVEVKGIILKTIQPLYTYPCDSEILKMWKISKKHNKTLTCKLNFVRQKMITFDLSDHNLEKMYIMPFLHTNC